jgi:hypothetical protein
VAEPVEPAAAPGPARERRPVPVDQPLLLITQPQRSGGTLLQRLLDGHPQCHVLPFQFRGIDAAITRGVATPEEAWEVLYDPKLAERFRHGHRQRKRRVLRDEEVFPFTLPTDLQRAIFDECAARLGEPDTRSLIGCYLTAYFNAWLDYGNLGGAKRWVVGFEPGIAGTKKRRARIRKLDPQGRVVSIVRDPWSWYASASRWEPRWQDRERALDHWCRLSEATAAWKEKMGPRLRIVSFEELLVRTEATMRGLAAWLEIDFTPGLLEPTFNGRAISANTSFGDVAKGVSAKPLDRARDKLSADDVAYIESRARVPYERLLELAGA